MKIKTPCFLCRKNEFERLFFTEGFWIVRCQKCGMVITLDKDFKRTLDSNLEIYTRKDYSKAYLSKGMQKILSERAKKRLKELEKLVNGRKILDVGCSYGTFIKVAQERSWQAEGVEPCERTTQFLRKNTNLKVYCGTLAETKLDGKLDVVSYWDVLEHVPDPVEELVVARKHLKKSGLLALQLPNFGSLSARIARQRFGWLCPEDHLNHFTPKTLSFTLKKAGFEILEMKTWSGGVGPFLSIFNDVFPEKKTLRPIRFIFLKLGYPIFKLSMYPGGKDSVRKCAFRTNFFRIRCPSGMLMFRVMPLLPVL